MEHADRQTLEDLQRDYGFLELDNFVAPLQIFRALSVARDEFAHSRLIATLLDPRQHRGAEIMLRTMLRAIREHEHLACGAAERLQEMLDAPWTNMNVRREFEFIDIVVLITTPLQTFVVGIENKIDAAEGKEQLGRYQRALERAFLGQTSVMVFLTPTRREPTTSIPDHPIPTVAIGYELIVEAVEEALQQAEPASRDRRTLSEIATHLREDILDEETEVKALVRELWRSHGRALRLAMEHRPRLEDIREIYESLLHERFGDDMYTYYWQSKGELREIKMCLVSWEEAGFSFEFILRVDDEGVPVVRLLLWRDSYDENAPFLKKWAREVNVAVPTLVDEEFTKLRNWWGWRRVLLEEEAPSEAVLSERAFDEATAREAVEIVTRLHEKLAPYIETD